MILTGPSTEERVIEALRKGLSVSAAAALAGITPWAIYDWLRKGSPDPRTGQIEDATKRRFVERAAEARAEAEAFALDVVLQAAKGWEETTLEKRVEVSEEGTKDVEIKRVTTKKDWHAAAWYLERARSETYGRKREVGQQEGDEEPIKRVILIETVEELAASNAANGIGNGVH